MRYLETSLRGEPQNYARRFSPGFSAVISDFAPWQMIENRVYI